MSDPTSEMKEFAKEIETAIEKKDKTKEKDFSGKLDMYTDLAKNTGAYTELVKLRSLFNHYVMEIVDAEEGGRRRRRKTRKSRKTLKKRKTRKH